MTGSSDPRTALIAERDAMVAELRDRWPAMASDMADLLDRLDANRRQTDHAGIASAEAIARGIRPDGTVQGGQQDFAHIGDVRRLGSVVLPQLYAGSAQARTVTAWPR